MKSKCNYGVFGYRKESCEKGKIQTKEETGTKTGNKVKRGIHEKKVSRPRFYFPLKFTFAWIQCFYMHPRTLQIVAVLPKCYQFRNFMSLCMHVRNTLPFSNFFKHEILMRGLCKRNYIMHNIASFVMMFCVFVIFCCCKKLGQYIAKTL